jgi:Xaa-Pro aminopeptidase
MKPLLVPGVSERELALALEFALKRSGAEEKAFDFIVASGERGALPHGIASEKKIGRGELVTIDFGSRVNGYHSDETVTVAVGEIDDKAREIFDTVLAAHDQALAAVRPGISIVALDAVARGHIARRGYGEFFGHGLGHGVGLEIHEYPSLSPNSEGFIEEGMVITIEPGIYVPGLGGVRIEDTVVVTSDGYRCLTRIPKQFQQFLA